MMRDRFPRLGILGASLVLALTVSTTSVQADGMVPGQRTVACEPPSSTDDGWTTASPDSVGMDGAQLCAIAARLGESATSVHSVVVAAPGKLVFEQSFAGYDGPWGQPEGQHEFTATTKHD